MFDHAKIDRIVANVLRDLGQTVEVEAAVTSASAVSDPAKAETSPTSAEANDRVVSLDDRVITAETIESVGNGVQRVRVAGKAIVTPAARDVLKERGLALERSSGESKSKGVSQSPSAKGNAPVAAPSGEATKSKPRDLVLTVRHTAAGARVVEDLLPDATTDLLGCPDDAAKAAISELCRGAADRVFILAEQTYRAACLANRQQQVKAVAIDDVGAVRRVRTQLRANVWCLDPSDRSYFELRNVMRAIIRD